MHACRLNDEQVMPFEFITLWIDLRIPPLFAARITIFFSMNKTPIITLPSSFFPILRPYISSHLLIKVVCLRDLKLKVVEVMGSKVRSGASRSR